MGHAGLGQWAMRLAVLSCLAILAIGRTQAADIGRASAVVSMVYDIGLYQSEVDRIMAQADTRGVFGGGGSTPATRARDRARTRATMMAQRDAVLRVASQNVAARATDPQLAELQRLAAAANAAVDQRLMDGAVAAVKAGFEDAVWDQLARTARGNAEFPCTKDQRGRC